MFVHKNSDFEEGINKLLRSIKNGMQNNLGEICCPMKIKGRICNVSRICRTALVRSNDLSNCTIPCPLVFHEILTDLKSDSNFLLKNLNKAVRSHLSTLAYWDRCRCSPQVAPIINQNELFLFLSCVPNHRFIVVYVTNSLERSIVIGTESLLESVYKLLQLPQLRPCLQRPSEPSIGILNLDLADAANETSAEEPNKKADECFQLGSVLIFQQRNLLYIGRPLEDYGCSPKKFLEFISKKTKHDFCKGIFNK